MLFWFALQLPFVQLFDQTGVYVLLVLIDSFDVVSILD